MVEKAKAILRWIATKQVTSFTRRDVHQGMRGLFQRVIELDAPLDVLVERCFIRQRAGNPNPGAGRPPSATYDVNPLWKPNSEYCEDCRSQPRKMALAAQNPRKHLKRQDLNDSGAQGNLQSLVGGLRLKVRIQHPGVHERTDRGGSYWFFRYWEDVLQQDGTTKAIRKFHTIGPSKGDNRLSKKQAEVERDKFLAKINKPTIQEKVADGLALFSKMVEKYRAAHVEAEVAGRFLLAKPTREKYIIHLEQRIVPKWGDRRLCEINPDEVQQWLFETCDSWHMMNDLRGIMSGIYTKAEDWGYWPEGRRNPMSRVKIGEKWSVRPERILTEERDREGAGPAERSQPAGAGNRHRYRRAHLRNPGVEVVPRRS